MLTNDIKEIEYIRYDKYNTEYKYYLKDRSSIYYKGVGIYVKCSDCLYLLAMIDNNNNDTYVYTSKVRQFVKYDNNTEISIRLKALQIPDMAIQDFINYRNGNFK